MHKLGITFMVLTLLLGIGVILLGVGILGARGAWQDRVDTRTATLEGQEERLAEAQRRVAELQEQVNRFQAQWGRTWTNIGNTTVLQTPEGPRLQLGLGANAGLPRAGADGTPPVVYIFKTAPAPAGYLGEFELTQVDADRALAQLRRRPMEGEAATWQGQSYQLHLAIPVAYRDLLADLQSQLVIAQQRLLEENKRVERLEAQLESSREALAARMKELEGNPDAPQDASDVIKDGLIASLKQASDQRDAALVEVDRLRRLYRNKSLEMERLIELNSELVDALPGGDNGSAPPEEEAAAARLRPGVATR